MNVIYNRTSDDADVMLHHVVKLEQGASLTLLESGPAAARLGTVMEVDVADNAAFHHVRTQGGIINGWPRLMCSDVWARKAPSNPSP